MPDTEIDSPGDFGTSAIKYRRVLCPLQLIRGGLGGVVTNHYNFSTTESARKKLPRIPLPVFIKEILKRDLGFEGLTFTDIPVLTTLAGKKEAG